MGSAGYPFGNEGRAAMSAEKLAEHFSAIKDPRCAGKVEHRLIDIQAYCEQHCLAVGATSKPVFNAFDDSHGRLVRRRVFVCPEAASLKALGAWPGLRTVLAVESIRSVNGSGKTEAEIRYFLSSCRDDPRARRRYKLPKRGFLLDQCVRSTTSRNVQSPAQASFFLNMPCNTVCRIGRVSKKPRPDIT
jgi:hypothetical protein